MVTATAFGVHRRNYATRRELYANELSLGAIRRHFSETRGAWTRSQSATAAPGDAANGQVTPTNQPTRKQRRRASRIRIDSQDVFDRELLARRTTTTATTATTGAKRRFEKRRPGPASAQSVGSFGPDRCPNETSARRHHHHHHHQIHHHHIHHHPPAPTRSVREQAEKKSFDSFCFFFRFGDSDIQSTNVCVCVCVFAMVGAITREKGVVVVVVAVVVVVVSSGRTSHESKLVAPSSSAFFIVSFRVSLPVCQTVCVCVSVESIFFFFFNICRLLFEALSLSSGASYGSGASKQTRTIFFFL